MDSSDFNLKLNPAVVVIFGITGDLSTRKLIPALYELQKNGLLHPQTQILGITRHGDVQVNNFLRSAHATIVKRDGSVDLKAMQQLADKTQRYQMNAATADGYGKLKDYLDKIEDKVGVCMSRIFYLAIPPQISAPIIRHLGEHRLNHGCDKHNTKSRLLLEKPFGFDTLTAQELIDETTKHFSEKQIFRIDHYLAKETVQNIVTFRFRNPIFEDIWSNKHIKSIEVVADESLDIEGRANFYEQTGALRDLVQSHLLHVMSVVMMRRPVGLMNADDIHDSRLKLLNSIKQVPADKLSSRALRGQYKGYLSEVDNPSSQVETFAAIKLFSSDPNWQNVPIYIRSGKALAKKQTKVEVCFKTKDGDHDHTNQLIFNIQPEEGITVELSVKKPGFERTLEQAKMNFSYQQTFDEQGHPEAYERVLVDAIRGDHTLFATSAEVMSCWRILQPVIEAWTNNDTQLLTYDKGSNGPDVSRLNMI